MPYIEKVSLLTGIPVSNLKKIWEAMLLIISQDLQNQEEEDIKKVIIPPLGNLEIYDNQTELKCKFTPSNALTKVLTSTTKNNNDLLNIKLEKKLIERLKQISSGII